MGGLHLPLKHWALAALQHTRLGEPLLWSSMSVSTFLKPCTFHLLAKMGEGRKCERLTIKTIKHSCLICSELHLALREPYLINTTNPLFSSSTGWGLVTWEIFGHPHCVKIQNECGWILLLTCLVWQLHLTPFYIHAPLLDFSECFW